MFGLRNSQSLANAIGLRKLGFVLGLPKPVANFFFTLLPIVVAPHYNFGLGSFENLVG